MAADSDTRIRSRFYRFVVMRQFVVYSSRVCVSFVMLSSFCYFWWVFPIKLTDPSPPPPSCRHGPRRLPNSSHHITACFVRSRCIFAGKSLVILAKSYLLHGTSEPTTTTKILRNSLHVSNKYRSSTHTHTIAHLESVNVTAQSCEWEATELPILLCIHSHTHCHFINRPSLVRRKLNNRQALVEFCSYSYGGGTLYVCVCECFGFFRVCLPKRK